MKICYQSKNSTIFKCVPLNKTVKLINVIETVKLFPKISHSYMQVYNSFTYILNNIIYLKVL